MKKKTQLKQHLMKSWSAAIVKQQEFCPQSKTQRLSGSVGATEAWRVNVFWATKPAFDFQVAKSLQGSEISLWRAAASH